MSSIPLAFVGDVHLEQDDPDLESFLDFLRGLGRRSRRIVLMGDLFTIWVGRPELELPHQRAVLELLRELRRRGVVVRYVEGNRDYRIGEAHAGDALDDGSDDGFEERVAGRRLYAVHGHLANPADRQYRRWHRLSRSALFWRAFHALPRQRRLRWVEAMERKMRGTNLKFKGAFPEAVVRTYTRHWFDEGYDAVVLGHFHVEKTLAVDRDRAIYVLPEWKGTRRHLELNETGRLAFVDWEG